MTRRNRLHHMTRPPRGREILCMGDSRSVFNMVPIINASTYTWAPSVSGYMHWLLPLCNQRVHFPNDGNFSVNGVKISGTGGMADKALSDPTWAVNSTGFYTALTHPARTGILFGAPNDFAGGIALQTVKDATLEIVRAFRASGKCLIIFNGTPVGVNDSGASQNALSVGNAANAKAWADWVMTLHDYPRVIAVDTWTPLLDVASGTNYTNIVGTLYDGLHPNAYGSYLIAVAAAPGVNSIFTDMDVPRLPVSDSDTYNATTNPFGSLSGHPMLPTSLNGGSKTAVNGAIWTGNVCTGCSFTNNSNAGPMTFTCSQGVNADGYDQQSVSWAGTCTAGNGSLTMTFGSSTTNLAALLAGDLIQFMALLGFNPSTMTGVAEIKLILGISGSVNPTLAQVYSSNTSGASFNLGASSIPAIRAPFVTPVLDTSKLGGTLSNFQGQVIVTFKQSVLAAGSLDMSRMAIRKIKPPHYWA